jgi:S1-C subfamily serine protease
MMWPLMKTVSGTDADCAATTDAVAAATTIARTINLFISACTFQFQVFSFEFAIISLPARSGDPRGAGFLQDRRMTNDFLTSFSDQLADAVAAAAPSVVQVQGRRRPASGLVYADNVVLTTVRALGREDGLRVRRHDGRTLDAELAGWDPTTSLAVLRVPGIETAPIVPAPAGPRVGHLALAVARSWSNAVTASAGIVSVIGGPLPTGRRRAIDEVIRTTAPMHDGFAGGAFLNTSGALIGIATAAAIRGLGVVIPAAIAWKTAATVLEHGSLKRGFLGIAGQPVALPETQQRDGREEALLVVGVTAGSPAASAGVLVGDVVLEFDGHVVESPEDLLDLLVGDRVGRQVSLRALRGGEAVALSVTVGERPAS